MRKQTKLVAVRSATALLAIGAAMTSFAATGWQEADGTWVYYDNDEDLVTDEWKKSGDEWYYLDEDGYMATNKLVDDNYYVDENGRMVKNQWVEVSEVLDDFDSSDPDAADSIWYYFQNNGKAVENGWKSINGAWYYFASYEMQSGWQSDIDNETYYLGDENDGAMKTGWQYLEPEDEDDATSPSDSENWYYFGSNGKMVNGKVDKKINGKYYSFDTNGVMLSGWVYVEDTAAPVEHDDVSATASNAADVSNYKYYGEEEDGSRQAGWLKVSPAKYVHDTDSTYWFYFSSGKAKHSDVDGNKLITVNSKKYAFNTKGEMQAGDKVVEIANATTSDAGTTVGTTNIFYFGPSTDGSMKTGKQNVYIDDEGETYTYHFATSGAYKGQAYIGEKDGYLYDENGRLQKASADLKYEEATNPVDGDTYLVNTSGKVMKASKDKTKTYKDKDDVEYIVNDKGQVQ